MERGGRFDTGPALSAIANSPSIRLVSKRMSAWPADRFSKLTVRVGAGSAPTWTGPKSMAAGLATTSRSTPTPSRLTTRVAGSPSLSISSCAVSGPACVGRNWIAASDGAPRPIRLLSGTGSLKLEEESLPMVCEGEVAGRRAGLADRQSQARERSDRNVAEVEGRQRLEPAGVPGDDGVGWVGGAPAPGGSQGREEEGSETGIRGGHGRETFPRPRDGRIEQPATLGCAGCRPQGAARSTSEPNVGLQTKSGALLTALSRGAKVESIGSKR